MLPSRMRIVLIGAYRDEWTMSQSAKQLDLSVGQISRIQALGLRLMQQVLADHNNSDAEPHVSDTGNI